MARFARLRFTALLFFSVAHLGAASAPAPVAYGRLPLSFEQNQGQTNRAVKFLARGAGYSLFLTPAEAVMSLGDGPQAAIALRMRLDGANPAPILTGEDLARGRSNYLVGRDRIQWRTNVKMYGRVRCAGVYPGVDMVYYGNQQQLEYDFQVAPRADPARIALAFDGAKHISLDADGSLLVETVAGNVRWHPPVLYQISHGQRLPVTGGYEYSLTDGNRIGFKIGHYDKSLPLTIDPVCVYSTFFGGSQNDRGVGIAADRQGCVFVAGTTESADFPTANTGVQTGDTGDMFIAKLTPDGSGVIYSTYVGSRRNNYEAAGGLAVDAQGCAYLTGETGSAQFPTTPGAFQPEKHGPPAVSPTVSFNYNAFALKLSPDGTQYVYSTYLGGTEPDLGDRIAVDREGNAFVVGETQSPDFPTTLPAPPNPSHEWRTFLTKLAPDGRTLAYSLIFAAGDRAVMAIDPDGNAYVTGRTLGNSLPVTPGAFQQATGRQYNSAAFVTKFGPDGHVVYCTYLAGSQDDVGTGIAVDDRGQACVVGNTSSRDFPIKNPNQTKQGEAYTTDVFVTKLTADGSGLVFSTYLGGSEYDHAGGIAVGTDGSVYVTGSTMSPDFPVKDALQPKYGGGYDTRSMTTGVLNMGRSQDAFVTKFTSGGALDWSTYLGGNEGDYGTGIACDPTGHVSVIGSTASDDFPVYHAGQPQNRRNLHDDGYYQNTNVFIVKIADG